MTQAVKHGADSREPFVHNGKEVPYTTQRRLKDGTLVYDFQGPRVNGKRASRVTLRGTPTDVYHEIERLLPVTRNGEIGDRTIKLEPLFKSALQAMKDGTFKHSDGRYSERTIELFEQRAEDHVLDLLGRNMAVADIRVAHLRKMQTALEGKGTLGGSAIRGCLSCASTLLRYAVVMEVRDENPANKIGRGERPSAKRKTPPRYLSISQARKLFASTSEDTRPIAATMFWAALRVSEALALRWVDVGDVLSPNGTKTRASEGKVPLHPELVAVLRAHRERMMLLGFDRVAPDALVFQTRSGKPIDRHNVKRAISRAGRKAGLQREGEQPIGCHDLRHSLVANYLGKHKDDMVGASKIARHANPGVTAQVYADLVEDGLDELGEKLAALG